MNNYTTRPLFLHIVFLIVGILLGFFFGSIIGRSSEKLAYDKMELKGVLLTNTATYQALDKVNIDLAKHNVQSFIKMNLKAYEQIRENNPTFGSDDKDLQKLLEQARNIVK